MDVTFFENQPYLTKNTLQGESVVEEDLMTMFLGNVFTHVNIWWQCES